MTFQRLDRDRDLDDAELEELERFLASPALVETSMDLYGVDGFFAAILSGPRTLMPSEWMPWIWDSDRRERAPEFEDLAHAQRMIELLMRHYNTVARALMNPDEPFAPIYFDGETDAAVSWCAGYLTGVALDPAAWEALVLSKPSWFAPILGLGAIDEESEGPTPAQTRQWSRAVGRSAAKIHGYWLEKRRTHRPGVPVDPFAGRSGRAGEVSSRVGRNDPCPCGSGRKFKRCCGASRSPK